MLPLPNARTCNVRNSKSKLVCAQIQVYVHRLNVNMTSAPGARSRDASSLCASSSVPFSAVSLLCFAGTLATGHCLSFNVILFCCILPFFPLLVERIARFYSRAKFVSEEVVFSKD